MAWMSEEAAATVLGVTFRAIRRRVGNGSLRAMRQGRQIFVDIEIARIPTPTQLNPSESASVATANSNTGVAVPNPAPVVTEPVALPVAVPASPLVSRPAPTSLAGNRPMPVNPLSAATVGRRLAPSPIPTGAVAISSKEFRAGSWVGPLIWLLLTLFLSASTAAGWMYHQGTLHLQEAEGRCRQLTITAQQTQTEHERQIVAQTTIANERENKLAGELSATKSKLDETARSLTNEKKTNAKLSSSITETSADLARVQTERQALTHKLMSAQASISVLQWQAAATDVLGQFAGRLTDAMQSSRRPSNRSLAVDSPVSPRNVTASRVPDDSGGAQPATSDSITAPEQMGVSSETDDTAPRRRLVPHQPPTLGQEDARAALRPIVAPNPRKAAASAE